MNGPIQGRVVWHDLYTNDLKRAAAFYGELLDWDVRDEGGWNLIYDKGGKDHFGSMMPLQPVMKAPPHWLAYFAVDDLDAGMARVKAAGGRLHTDKMRAGKTGEFAVVADPQGAAFMLWHYLSDDGKAEPSGPPPAGRFCWDELMTTDPDGAKKFYASVFGYDLQDVPMPDMVYTLLRRPGTVDHDGQTRRAAGLMKSPAHLPMSFWGSYVAVDDCDASLEKATQLGAQTLYPATDIPNVGRFATLKDPTGAAFSILAAPKP